jgi:hypothetical protein
MREVLLSYECEGGMARALTTLDLTLSLASHVN